MNHCTIKSQFRSHLLQSSFRIRKNSVKFVDKNNKGDVISFHLTKNGDSLRLNTTRGANYKGRTVQNSQSTLDFNFKSDDHTLVKMKYPKTF